MLFQRIKKPLVFFLIACMQLAPLGNAFSQTLPLPPVPPNISTATAKPMMMVAASRDQTLFGPAYTDFEDLDGDDVVDFTFKPAFSYYGYFDSGKCYTYSTTNNRFDPAIAATVTSDSRITCSSAGSYWAGNFLNWATMTRIDVIRKMLYGGKRSTDTTTLTVLERANLSQDAHSFAKFYSGTDIRDYTPFTTANLTKTTGSNANVYAGLTICNRSTSSGSAGTPVIRLAKGNYELWATTAGSVCRWGGTEAGPGFAAKVTTVYGTATLGAATKKHESAAPVILTDGATYGTTIGPELNVRVVACNSTLLGDERCQPYGTPTAIYKPIGLFQEFGISPTGGSAKAEFGMITGSYDSNIEAGALRKNVETFDAEIDTTTGRFCHIIGATGSCAANYKGGVAAMDAFQLYGAGNYNGNNGLDFALPDEMTNGLFPAWGNPMGEMVLQAIRYYAGLPVTPAAKTTGLTTGIDTALGIPTVTATNPFTTSTAHDLNYGKPICRPLSILGISSSAVGYDRNFAGFDDLPNRGTATVAAYTSEIGVKEKINGTVRTVGSVTGGFGTDCAAKTVTTLDLVTGVCPDLPGAQGSYLVAGAAFYANTKRIRDPGSSPPTDLPATALTVKTYAASLAGGLGRVEIKVPGTSKFVYLTPESSWNDRDYVGGGTRQQRYPNRPTKTTGVLMPGGILVFKAISSSATHGAFIVTWNDTQAGNDYDMDITGFLRYDITGSGSTARIKVTTEIMDQEAGALGSHGYSIVGTDADGKYITHGINAFKDEGLCLTAAGCSLNTSATALTTVTRSFAMTGVQDVTVEDPLWYAAKYGGFDTGASTFGPGQTLTVASWDQKRADGRACGGSTGLSCSDGIPDGYFLARRPELLERQLRDQLEQIVASSNAAPAVSASTLDDGEFKYEATFDATVKKGSVLAKQLDNFGNFNTVATWDAGELLKQLPIASRQIMTNDDNQAGITFQWSSMDSTYTTALKGTSSTSLDVRGQALIDYMRGNTNNEAPVGQKFQPRSVSNLLGTIVNSSPWIEAKPGAFFSDASFPNGPSYETFFQNNRTRDKLLWIGSNDGMLHAFKALTGDPVLSYVPRPLVPTLQALAEPSTGVSVSGMDGSPYTGDVLRSIPSSASNTWSTYLFSSLGRGGRGIFALDVTNPAALTQANAASIFKWQFTSSDDPDLGYVIGDPRMSQFSGQANPIVRLNTGKFGILVPNGIGSASGKAKLIILGVDGPGTDKVWHLNTDYYELDTYATDSGNGMMGADWIDYDGNGTADYVYTTDLKGNIWKFDIRDANPSNWTSAFKSGGLNIPFYSARNSAGTALPITTAPAFGFPADGGVMVSFGTGKALASTGDFPNTTYSNRMYGVYDRTGTTATFTLPTGTSTLVLRNYYTTPSGTSAISVTAADLTIDLTTKNGWYFNFPAASEMVLSSPDAKAQYMLFTTVKAADTTANQCFYTPPGQLYTIDPNTGIPNATNFGRFVDPVTGVITIYAGVPIADQKVNSTRDASSRVQPCDDPSSQACFCKSNPTDAACSAYKPVSCDPNTLSDRVYSKQTDLNTCINTNNSRIQWREIPGLKTRSN